MGIYTIVSFEIVIFISMKNNRKTTGKVAFCLNKELDKY